MKRKKTSNERTAFLDVSYKIYNITNPILLVSRKKRKLKWNKREL